MKPKYFHHQILQQALVNPNCLVNYSDSDWELLIRMARRVKLLARLALLLKNHNLWHGAPERIRNQLTSALFQADRLKQLTRWELDRVLWALDDLETNIIVLKGAAYGLIGLPFSEGRLSVDLDILVPQEDLADIESVLMSRGWKHKSLSFYDEYYYRVWSHEIPPLVHAERETEVDIHHTLAPVTSRLKIDTALLFADAVPVDYEHVKVLSPVDMTLHCVVNLFQNNELDNDLRDLLDVHDLMVFFSRHDNDFWMHLMNRANQLNLEYLLYYGFYFCQLIFKTPVPEGMINRLKKKPGYFKRRIMHWLVPLALFPQHPDKPLKSASWAKTILYLRSHLIRMPLYILVPHLVYKTARTYLAKIKLLSASRR